LTLFSTRNPVLTVSETGFEVFSSPPCRPPQAGKPSVQPGFFFLEAHPVFFSIASLPQIFSPPFCFFRIFFEIVYIRTKVANFRYSLVFDPVIWAVTHFLLHFDLFAPWQFAFRCFVSSKSPIRSPAGPFPPTRSRSLTDSDFDFLARCFSETSPPLVAQMTMFSPFFLLFHCTRP